MSEEAKEVYNSLIESPSIDGNSEPNPLRMLRSGVPVLKPRIRGNKHSTLEHGTKSFSSSSGIDSSFFSHSEEMDLHEYGSKTLPKLRNYPGPSQKVQMTSFLDQQNLVYNLESYHPTLGIENNQNHNNVVGNNPPLPPRDRSKSLQPKSSLPRHQRKYPLILPGGVVSSLTKMDATFNYEDQVDGEGLTSKDNEVNGSSFFKPSTSGFFSLCSLL